MSVALIIFISIENPLALNSMNLLSASLGAIVGTVGLYLVMPWSNHPLWFSVVTYAFLFPAVWLQAKPKFLVPAITFMFVVSTLLDPTNPQQYNLSSTLNTAAALICGYAITRPLFLLIGPPNAGRERMAELLQRMRKHIRDHLKEPHEPRRTPSMGNGHVRRLPTIPGGSDAPRNPAPRGSSC